MMKYIFPLFFLFAVLFSFKTDTDEDNAIRAARYYDSIAYYEDGSPKYMRYYLQDSSIAQYWFASEGRVAKYINIWKSYRYQYHLYAPDGRMIFDSTKYGNAVVKRYDSSGYCHDYRMYYFGYGVMHPTIFSEQYILDERDNISNYITRDSLGNVTGDYYYPLHYLEKVELKKVLRISGNAQSTGVVIRDTVTDSLRRCGLWQTYHFSGRIETIGLYFNGVADGLHVAFDTIGKPVKWIYYTKGVPDKNALSEFKLDSMYFEQGARAEQYWSFKRNGRDHMDGPLITINKNGYVSQFVYMYNGNSIRGADPFSAYQAADQWTIPVIMGGHQRLMMQCAFDRNDKLVAKGTAPFITESFCQSYNGKQILASRQTLNEYAGYSCNGTIPNSYMFRLPTQLMYKTQFDSCIKRNDTTWFYLEGHVNVKKQSGYRHQDILYHSTDKDGIWHVTIDSNAYSEYVLLPNGKWFKLQTTNCVPPGMMVRKVGDHIVHEGFRYPGGYSGWQYSYSAKTGVMISQSYIEGRRETGKYKRWYDDGQLAAKGKYNRKGEEKGIWKKYDGKGKFESRRRYINGRQYGVERKRICGCLSITRKRNKVCRTLYWSNKKVCRLNIICRRRKYNPW